MCDDKVSGCFLTPFLTVFVFVIVSVFVSAWWLEPICCNPSQVWVVWQLFEPPAPSLALASLLTPPGNLLSVTRQTLVPTSTMEGNNQYLSKLLNVFLKMVKLLCPNRHLFEHLPSLTHPDNIGPKLNNGTKHLQLKMYLPKLSKYFIGNHLQ